jgi:predicted PurR-regulated permease PerM
MHPNSMHSNLIRPNLIRPNLLRPDRASDSSRLLTLIAMVVVIAGLYFGRQVFIPLALAVVLAFLLTPVVGWLEKCRLGRVPSVLIVLILSFALMGLTSWIVTGQLMEIVDQLPSYRLNIHEKIQSLRVPNSNRLKNASNTVTELSNELSAASEAAATNDSASSKRTGKPSTVRPIPVQVSQAPSSASQYVRAMIGPLTGVLETAAMVIVFTLFILIKREDLRNRLIRLAGQDQLNVVTQALDDASRRLSRYLFLQFLINLTYGVLFACGAYWIGIPNALLWGVLGSLLRFVPYVGTPIAAAFPIAMALAVFPGWHQAVFVFCLYAVLEISVANIIEPWLYGAQTGVSSLAILLAAVFWSSLWGPVGLILSTPLTVCLILIGRYVPQLGFLEVLLGVDPVLPVEAHFYQRLLAFDQQDAVEIAETYLAEKPIGSFYDSVMVPALVLAERDRRVDSLEGATVTFINQSIQELIEDLEDRPSVAKSDRRVDRVDENKALDDGAETLFEGDGATCSPSSAALTGLRVVVIPAAGEADELAGMMLEQLLRRLGCDVRRVAIPANGAIAGGNGTDENPADWAQAAVVSALPPFAAGPARLLCKRLRQSRPSLKILLGLWSFNAGGEKPAKRTGSGAADMVATSFQQAIEFLLEINLQIPADVMAAQGPSAEADPSEQPRLVTQIDETESMPSR